MSKTLFYIAKRFCENIRLYKDEDVIYVYSFVHRFCLQNFSKNINFFEDFLFCPSFYIIDWKNNAEEKSFSKRKEEQEGISSRKIMQTGR